MRSRAALSADKAELASRLCSIRLVSWQWNEKGVAILHAQGRAVAPTDPPESGVIAQDVRRHLASLFPEIVVQDDHGNFMVNYGLLGDIALSVFKDLYKDYQQKVNEDTPSLESLLEKHASSSPQLGATRLLALVHRYSDELSDKL